MPRPRPDFLVDPGWLEQRLDDPALRVFDCTLTRVPQPSGASLWQSGRDAWEKSHIPGAGYLHMIDDLSDPDGPFAYALPSPETIQPALASAGVPGDGTVVLYGEGTPWVIHRAWWVLMASGAADVRVLDGGWRRWLDEGRPVESGASLHAPATFHREARRSLIADAGDVEAALEDGRACLIHALTSEQFHGAGGQVYGRPGRIPGSISIPAGDMMDLDTGRFRSIDELSSIFDAAGIGHFETIIPYCGGGIAASTVFFALALAGYENVRLYDGSLLDWTSEPARPMVTG